MEVRVARAVPAGRLALLYRDTMRARGVVAPMVLTGTCLALLAWTWKTWPDVISDTGRELYHAWRLSEGDVLYRDVAHFNGPLSPYLDALWFRLFGPGLTRLVAADLAVVAALTALIVRGGRALVDGFTALAAGIAFLCLFAFGPLTPGGSFGYLAPYSHEMTHGVLLLLLLLACVAWDQRAGGWRPPLVAGLLLGLVFLTKPELWLAGAAAAAVGFTMGGRARGRSSARALAFLLLGALPAPLASWSLLALAMPAGEALRGTLGAWVHLRNPDLLRMPYFQIFMGTWLPLASLLALVFWSLCWTAVLGTLWFLARWAGARSWQLAAGTGAVLLVAAALVAFAHRSVAWMEAMRPLPLFLVGLIAVEVRRGRPEAVLRITLAVLSLGLLLKMLLFARVWHYGFVLAMPATLTVIAALLCWIPAGLAQWRHGPAIYRTGAAGLLAAVLVAHLAMIDDQRRTKTVRVGRGADAFWADAERGEVVRAAHARLEALLPRDATLAVLPDGVLLNYLTRRRNSTPYVIANPADMAMFGERPMLDAYLASPPDWVVLTACDTAIYGFRYFGIDYAQSFARWLDRDYVLVEVIGAPPFRGDGFGVALLRRRGEASARDP